MEELTSEKTCIRISVRNLVEFVIRSGDIDNRRTVTRLCWRDGQMVS